MRPPHLRRKLGLRRDEDVLLGFATGSKAGYTLLKMDSRTVITRSDVTFFPDIFPFRDIADQREFESKSEDVEAAECVAHSVDVSSESDDL